MEAFKHFAIVLCKHWRYALQGGHKYVYLLSCVVNGEAGSHGAGYAVAVHDRLGAVVSSTYGDAEFVEQGTCVVGMSVADKERYYRCLFGSGSEYAYSINLMQLCCSVFCKLFFVCGDTGYSCALHETYGLAQSKHVADRGSSRLEFERQLVVGGSFEGDILNHLSASLVRWHLLQQLFAAVHDTDTHGTVQFVARETVEVAAKGLHVHRHVGDGLRSVDEDGYIVVVGYAHYFGDWIDGAECVADMVYGNDACAVADEGAQRVKVEHPFVAEGYDAQARAVTLACQLPGDNVAVVFHGGDYHFVAVVEKALREAACHKVDALSGSPGEDNLVVMPGVYESLNLASCLLVEVGGLRREVMCAAVYVAVEGVIVIDESVDNTTRFLSRRGIVEVHERFTVYVLVQYWELVSKVHLVNG